MACKRAIKGTNIGQATLPIALVFGRERDYPSGVLRGIGHYARGCDSWALVSVSARRRLFEILHALKPVGIIVNDVRKGIADILRMTGRPVVNVSAGLTDPHFPQVTIDEVSIGSMAANCLLECGLRNFGYFGPPWDGLVSGRESGFRLALQRLSHTVAVCYVRPPGANPMGGPFASQKHICRWLVQLPKPAGVFAPTDTWARWLCGACKQEGIKVPDEIAVIGAGDDELMCELAQPTLSSVKIPAERIGYEAAALLDRLMRREYVSDKPLLLPATSVVTRQSTNSLAGVESIILAAVRFIREHICEPITVDDVVRNAHLPRRSFERKFREAIGRSPAQEIRRVRIATAKTFLAGNTRMKTDSVAQRCGFSSTVQFFTAFHQATGMTPADFRRTMGQESSRGMAPDRR